MKTAAAFTAFFVVVALFSFFQTREVYANKKVKSGHVGSGRARSGQVGQVGQVGSGRVRPGQVESGCKIVMTMVIGDHWIMHDFLLQTKHKNDYNLFDTPLLDSSLRNDLRNLNDFFNDLLDDR